MSDFVEREYTGRVSQACQDAEHQKCSGCGCFHHRTDVCFECRALLAGSNMCLYCGHVNLG